MAEPRGELVRRHIKGIVVRAFLLAAAYSTVLLAGMRSNVQGSLEMSAYGTIILFTLAIVVQLLVIVAFERRRGA